MGWLIKQAAPKEFNPGDIIECKYSKQIGVIRKMHSGHYMVEFASAPDTPFKRETKNLPCEKAAECYKKVGTVKLDALYFSPEAEEALKDKLSKNQWLNLPLFKMGQLVQYGQDLNMWTIVEITSNDTYKIIAAQDLNLHEVFEPITVTAKELALWAKPIVANGQTVEDAAYGTGLIIDASQYAATGSVDVLFEDMFQVKNYQLGDQAKREAADEEPFMITKCPTDNSYHTPCCTEHIELPSFAPKAALKRVAALTAEATNKVQSYLDRLLHKASWDMFMPTFYQESKRCSKLLPDETPLGEHGQIDVGTEVVRVGTNKTGIVILSNEKDESLKVLWASGPSTLNWRQELLVLKPEAKEAALDLQDIKLLE